MTEQIIPAENLFKREHISYSEWQLFKNFCQHRWKLDYNDDLRKKNYGIHLDFGTAIHESIELYKVPKGKIPIEDPVKHFEEKFKKLLTENKQFYHEKDKTTDEEKMLVSGKKILQHLHQCQLINNSTIMFNELELLELIDRDDIQIKFKGFIDAVVMTKKKNKTLIYVIDFKTCSWGWQFDKKQDTNVLNQLVLYKHFFCKKFDLEMKNVRTAFILLKKAPRTKKGEDIEYIETFEFSSGPITIQNALDSLNRDVDLMKRCIETNSAKKNLDSCISKYGDTCPYYKTEYCK